MINDALQELVNKQAESKLLWSLNRPASEQYIQAELRLLHAMIENRKDNTEKLKNALKSMIGAFESVPQMTIMGFDSPPEPASEEDYYQFLALQEAKEALK